jgi:hypothetical protein
MGSKVTMKKVRAFAQDSNHQSKSGLTKRAPDAGDSAAFSNIFLRLSIFPIGRHSAARPSAGNASRWLASAKEQKQNHL